MRFEVVPGEDGAVRVVDLRAALGSEALKADSVVVTVLSGTDVIQARICLIGKPSGRGMHRCFSCPRCGAMAAVLRCADGKLLCARCRPHRTERQRQRSTRWWRHEGGCDLDALQRLALRPAAARRFERMVALANRIMREDQDRVGAARIEAEAVL